MITAQGAPNIALIKYWGKRDEKLVLPFNSSLSLTISGDVMHTTTSVMLSDRLAEDVFYLDGKLQDLSCDSELKERFLIVDEMRKMAKTGDSRIMVVSKNDFPTAGGLASSASGIATLVFALNKALGLDLSPKELSLIARKGSGSACRSIFGGMVQWRKGKEADGSDSFSEKIFDANHWPDIIDMILVVSQSEKQVSSRSGMQQTVETNPLFASRPDSAELRVAKAIEAYRDRDFDSLAGLIMADSNEMHALMLSTIPPLRYLTKTSFEIMDRIEQLNSEQGKRIAAYSFDAGPNAHIITLKQEQEKVALALQPLLTSGEIQYMKVSPVGGGPKILDGVSLITDELKEAHALTEPSGGLSE